MVLRGVQKGRYKPQDLKKYEMMMNEKNFI
jgi:hypothetical protein